MSARPALAVDNDELGVESVREVVATAVGFTVGLADDRQMQLQSGFSDDESDHVINARLDRVMRFADRQKARYEIVALRKELAELQQGLFQGEEALAATDMNFEAAQAQLDVEILECNQQIAGETNRAYENAARTGRSRSSALKGIPQSNIDRWKKGIEDAQANKVKNVAERDQFRDEFVKTQRRRRARVEEIEGLIAEKEALLKG